jgi:hypothetical protein
VPTPAKIDQYRAYGLTRAILFAPVASHDEVMRFLDAQASLVRHCAAH